jgi:hypothetical protein
MRIKGHPIDLMVDMGADNSIVTQPVGPLSQKNTAIIRATGNWACNPFLVSRKCNLGSHEARHELLCFPDCSVSLMGRDLLCKLRVKITFDFDGIVALKLRGPETKTNSYSYTRRGIVALCL